MNLYGCQILKNVIFPPDFYLYLWSLLAGVSDLMKLQEQQQHGSNWEKDGVRVFFEASDLMAKAL